MTDDPLLQLVHVKLPASLYHRLESYWHDLRLPSRSVAIRKAIERMLDENDRIAARHAARVAKFGRTPRP